MGEPTTGARAWLQRSPSSGWCGSGSSKIEFLDRSVALAGKAFVSFFPLVIVVAAFVPHGHPDVDRHVPHGAAGPAGREPVGRHRRLRLLGRHPDRDRVAGPGFHDLLRQFVHDCPATRLRAYLAATDPHGAEQVPPRRRHPPRLTPIGMAVMGGFRGVLDGGLGRERLRDRVARCDVHDVVVHLVVPLVGRGTTPGPPSRAASSPASRRPSSHGPPRCGCPRRSRATRSSSVSSV